jgi:hypothetical protein
VVFDLELAPARLSDGNRRRDRIGAPQALECASPPRPTIASARRWLALFHRFRPPIGNYPTERDEARPMVGRGTPVRAVPVRHLGFRDFLGVLGHLSLDICHCTHSFRFNSRLKPETEHLAPTRPLTALRRCYVKEQPARTPGPGTKIVLIDPKHFWDPLQIHPEPAPFSASDLSDFELGTRGSSTLRSNSATANTIAHPSPNRKSFFRFLAVHTVHPVRPVHQP